MQVVIKEVSYEYESDFSEGWKYFSGDYFKYPVPIGGHECFIKRFEKKSPDHIPGWGLVKNLSQSYFPNIPRIYDIVEVEENRRKVFYVFYEFLKGMTLDLAIADSFDGDLKKLSDDIFTALASIHKHNFWFSDFCEKNIFCQATGKYLLLDLDSCQPFALRPENSMDGNKDYWALVFDFYRKVAGLPDIKLNELPGNTLNYLQVIFLLLRLKILREDPSIEYHSPTVFNSLPECLDGTDPAFRDFFLRAHAQSGLDAQSTAREAKELILQKIINGTINFKLSETAPEILRFDASTYEVDKDSSFSLDWEIKNAGFIEILKNGKSLKKLDPVHRSILISEYYDGRDKEIVYQLVAGNEKGTVQSLPVSVKIVDKAVVVIPPEPRPPLPQPIITEPVIENKPEVYKGQIGKQRKNIRLILLATLAAVLILGFVVFKLFFFSKVEITTITPAKTGELRNVVLNIKNLKPGPAGIKVLFNGVEGKVEFSDNVNVRVIVPELGESLGDGKVEVAVVNGQDTTKAGTRLLVERVLHTSAIQTPLPDTGAAQPIEITDPVISAEPDPEEEIKKPVRPRKPLKELTKDQQLPVVVKKADETPVSAKPLANMMEKISQSVKHGWGASGGVKDIVIKVKNNSPYDVELVTLDAVYMKNSTELKREKLQVTNLLAHAEATIKAPNYNRGSKVVAVITGVVSSQAKYPGN